MTAPDGVVAVITGTDLLRKLDSLSEAVSGLSAKIDSIPVTVAAHETKLADHEMRIRSVERRIWAAAGGCGAVSAVLAGLITFIVSRH